MDQKPLSPPQEKSAFVAPQQDAEMMDLIKRKGKPKKDPKVEGAITQLKQVMQANNIQPDQLIRAGEMAMMAIKDKSLYPMLAQMAVKEGLMLPNEVPPQPDYKMLAGVVSAGKLAQMIKEEGI
jgi:hypothetical protein